MIWICPTTDAVKGEGWNYDINSSSPCYCSGRALRLDSHLPYSGPLHNMTLKGFYLVGQDKDVYHQDIPIDQCHDFESLQIAIAEQYNIIQATGKHIFLKKKKSFTSISANLPLLRYCPARCPRKRFARLGRRPGLRRRSWHYSRWPGYQRPCWSRRSSFRRQLL